MSAKVAVLRKIDTPWLGRWRAHPGLEVHEADEQIWLRGPEPPDWNRLPAIERFEADDSGKLRATGNRMPTATLPAGPWVALSDFIRLHPPAAFLPAQGVFPVAWSLVRSEEIRQAILLVLPFEKFSQWALTTPGWRLESLSFALCEDGRTIVLGGPLPSLPGDFWSLENGIALPSGWGLPLGVTMTLVQSILTPQPDETLLLHQDCSIERIPKQAMIPVTRANVRASS